MSGPDAGALTPLSVRLDATPTTDRFGTGTGDDVGNDAYPASRFEQSLAVAGTVTAGGPARPVRAAGHRDRSWGPRNWRVAFTLGDLQSEHAQLYFVGAPQLGERGGGYLRDASGVRRIACVGGEIHYDDAARTIAPTRLRFADEAWCTARRRARADLAERQLRHGAHVRGARALVVLADPRRGARVGMAGAGARLGRSESLRLHVSGADPACQ